MLAGLEPSILLYFLEWSVSTGRNAHPHSNRLEKQLALLWAHAIEMANPTCAAAHPLHRRGMIDKDRAGQYTARLVDTFRRLESPDAQGIIFYYIIRHMLCQHKGDTGTDSLLVDFAEKGGLCVWLLEIG